MHNKAVTALHVEKDAVLLLNNNFSLYTMIFALKYILTSSTRNAL